MNVTFAKTANRSDENEDKVDKDEKDAYIILAPDSNLRPIMFLFYTVETIFNMFCMAFHISGFMSVDLEMLPWEKQMIHYFYLVTFYVFMVLTLFQSINICTGHIPSLCMEICKASAASFAFTVIAVTTMWDAERDFHLLYRGTEPEEGVYQKDEPVHPFFHFMRSQSIASLACGILYLLHATILIDIKITAYYMRKAEGEYLPLRLYVFGELVQDRLEKYEWFRDFSSSDQLHI
ncbi:CG34432 [Drosophila busckii]|uniref:CG34432 n=1 Tax=Drosophila busckii TaxID=30019 RepID=A0A0M4F728_DROBS|nr:uncharacterized protein LOC108602465 [Drosophila busckii]ALC47607.1 CG34432 [Drosophila busckii]